MLFFDRFPVGSRGMQTLLNGPPAAVVGPYVIAVRYGFGPELQNST